MTIESKLHQINTYLSLVILQRKCAKAATSTEPRLHPFKLRQLQLVDLPTAKPIAVQSDELSFFMREVKCLQVYRIQTMMIQM